MCRVDTGDGVVLTRKDGKRQDGDRRDRLRLVCFTPAHTTT